MYQLIILGVLLVAALFSTGWLFSKFSSFIGSLGIVGWLVILGIIYFVLKKFTPFGSYIDAIIKRILGLVKGAGSSSLKLIAIILAVVLGASFLGYVAIIPGWQTCTTETIEYAGLEWEIEGCPLGISRSQYEIATEHDQDYELKEGRLDVHSNSKGQGRSGDTVYITATTTVPEDKTFDLTYELTTSTGRSKIEVYSGFTRLLSKEKLPYGRGEGEAARWQKSQCCDEPGQEWYNEYQQGIVQCSRSDPANPEHVYTYDICYFANLPLEGSESITISKGQKIRVRLESYASEEGYGNAEVEIYTSKIDLPLGEEAITEEEIIGEETIVEETIGNIEEEVVPVINNIESTINSIFLNINSFFINLWDKFINLF